MLLYDLDTAGAGADKPADQKRQKCSDPPLSQYIITSCSEQRTTPHKATVARRLIANCLL